MTMGSKTLKKLLRRKPGFESKDAAIQRIKPSIIEADTERASEKNVRHSNIGEEVATDVNESSLERFPSRKRRSRRERLKGSINKDSVDGDDLLGESAAKTHGSRVSEMILETGSFILRQFIASLGAQTEASLNRGWVPGGSAIRQEHTWTYELRQGRDNPDLERIRAVLNGRLYRSGNRLQGGAWTRLLLGDEFTAEPSRKQVHELHYVLPYCVCINCRIATEKGDSFLDDMDAMVEDAERGNGFEELSAVSIGGGNKTRATDYETKEEKHGETTKREDVESARARATFGALPTPGELRLIGETLESHELELGTVSRISSRSAKVTFSPFARQFFGGNRYCGPLTMQQVAAVVCEKAKGHYRLHKGKTERRFYVHGTLNKFVLDGGAGAVLFPRVEHEAGEVVAVGVLFRRQMMSVFHGRLALEDSFGSFLETEERFYLGFGQDAEGAQSMLNNGKLGEGRHLGINELRTHLDVGIGNEVEIRLQ